MPNCLTSANIVINRLFLEHYMPLLSPLSLSWKSISVLIVSNLYIAIKDKRLQIIKCPRLWKNNAPEVTDLLRYWPMFEILAGRHGMDCTQLHFPPFFFKNRHSFSRYMYYYFSALWVSCEIFKYSNH